MGQSSSWFRSYIFFFGFARKCSIIAFFSPRDHCCGNQSLSMILTWILAMQLVWSVEERLFSQMHRCTRANYHRETIPMLLPLLVLNKDHQNHYQHPRLNQERTQKALIPHFLHFKNHLIMLLASSSLDHQTDAGRRYSKVYRRGQDYVEILLLLQF